jgi:opacity protein-like surface antigen
MSISEFATVNGAILLGDEIMTLRNAFFATAAALALGAGAASAQGFSGEGFYLKGFGGATFADDETLDLSGGFADFFGIRASLDYDTGYLLGAALGYSVLPNMDVEVEYTYRDVDGTLSVRDDFFPTEKFDETTKVNAVMLNAFYRFDPMGAQGQFRPYLGGGLGGARVDFDGDETDTELAWQVMAGVDFAVTPQWSLYGEARYFATQSGAFVRESDFFVEGGYDSIDLLVGAAYRF